MPQSWHEVANRQDVDICVANTTCHLHGAFYAKVVGLNPWDDKFNGLKQALICYANKNVMQVFNINILKYTLMNLDM